MSQFDAERNTRTLTPLSSVLLIQKSVKILVNIFFRVGSAVEGKSA